MGIILSFKGLIGCIEALDSFSEVMSFDNSVVSLGGGEVLELELEVPAPLNRTEVLEVLETLETWDASLPLRELPAILADFLALLAS